MDYKLVEIQRHDLIQLRDLYGEQRTSSCGYNLIQNYIDWIAQDATVDVHIYSLNGDWKEDGTFIAKDYGNIVCNTLIDNKSRLITALNCLDRNSKYLIHGFPDHCKYAIERHFLEIGLSQNDFKPEGTFWYHLPKEEAAKFKINPPQGITLKRLDVSNAEQVNSIWPHRSPGSVVFVERLIRFNESVGAFDVDGNLVAWVLKLHLGSMGLLQVLDSHKRKGLGSLVVRAMAKSIADKGLEPCAPVVFENIPSRRLFEGLGFQSIDKVWWAVKSAPNATDELKTE